MTPRYYSAEVIIYGTPEQILSCKYDLIRHYLLIYHDKDVNSDGTSKKPHTHMYCTFYHNLSFNQIARLFSDLIDVGIIVLPENVSCIHGNLKDCYQYALHLNAPDKYQYPEYMLQSDCLSYWIQGSILAGQDVSNENKAYQIVIDLLDNELPILDMIQKYGREFVINSSKYRDITKLCKEQRLYKRTTMSLLDDLI